MKTPNPSLARAAARNNAEWCAAMSRSHGVEGDFTEQAWAAPDRTPRYYPDAVTLVPGASVKDSFADLDLTAAGFKVLFEAQWIHRPASGPAASPEPADSPELVWSVASDPDALRDWALAWDDGNGDADLFRPGLLDDPATFVLTGRSADGRVAAGAVASRSDRVVGISNVFARDGGLEAAWAHVPNAVHTLFPALPVVGYEHGDDLAAAVRHGFEPIGPLRIWTHPGRD
ncbi:hypothetical protein [Streptomyces sp. NPDC001914]|uniref:hypothetical protein n=1 Tax=Streptomyces sp. NPDC001914 TaxID=3364623 RepID=UPI0036A1D37C